MPRKTKEQNETENKKTSAKKSTTKKTTAKKATTKKATATKTSTKKTASKTTKSTTKSKKAVAPKKPKVEIVEYYDLPYRYNQTVIKVLAQTPTTLFIYWDIADADREEFQKQYGENFFENSKPILIIQNKTLNYSFEVEINDFANSWYLHVNDAKCDYKIELGRRPIEKNEQLNIDYVHVATSNNIEVPNDQILFNKDQKMVYFRNVKTGVQIGKTISTVSFIKNIGRAYNIYDLYKALYNDKKYDLSNPSSGNPSSGSLSSKFK